MKERDEEILRELRRASAERRRLERHLAEWEAAASRMPFATAREIRRAVKRGRRG